MPQPTSRRPLRLISLEGAMGAFALYSLISGFMRGEILSIFWGVMIIGGLTVLYFVRRKDWQQHWATFSAEDAAHDETATKPD